MPDKITVVGDPIALLVIVTVPLSLPAAVGLNSTAKLRLCVGDNVTGVPAPLNVKPVPLTLIPEIVTFAFPVSVIVTFCVAELPVFTLPKLRFVELSEIAAVAATPFPLNASMLGELGALLTIETLPLAAPAPVGANCTLNVLLVPGLRDSGKLNEFVANPLPVTLNCITVSTPVPLLLN